ncbi:4-hydroxy-tetrahydrodipicolinate synthase [Agrilactobacillus yilanensis]|uniref:4-hydroxy-tetrahydrodipicolinate synthase n=1 Tax=Agrilactobacillus yilanensis TaxID=2485997 RepID=A0ABW4J5E4_9LACO|nr:4-hydroxy-tetrahydrodipicolinate synthase [Agrilactobacillus yilanensis]
MLLDDVSIITAMVTPFTDDNTEVDKTRLSLLVEHLLATGTDALLVGGTTGEGPTLSQTEKLDLLKETIALVKHRVPIIANVGTNNTKQTIDFMNQVAEIEGVDAALVVVPYYNKPNQAGLYAHFEAIAKNGKLPFLIYNIPGRTGVEIDVATILRLALLPNVIGVKDCTGITNLGALIKGTENLDFSVYTGEDNYAFAAKAMGANGVISVVSHLYGDELAQMYRLIELGKVKDAAKIQTALDPKIAALFSTPSPSATKAMLADRNLPVGGVRLPLVMPTSTEFAAVKNIMDN